MKTLHVYLTRQVLATLGMTILVFTFVLLLGNVLKEIIELLISRQATLVVVGKAVMLLIPFVLVFALPMGMLTAALLVFGRFSADQELTAVRSSGISLVALITPVLALSLALCGVSAVVNMDIAPRCRTAYKELIDTARANVSGLRVPEGRSVTDFKGIIFFAGKSDGRHFQNVRIIQLNTTNNNAVEAMTYADSGWLEETNKTSIVVHLKDVVRTPVGGDSQPASDASQLFELKSGPSQQKPSLSDMTFSQLRQQERDMEELLRAPPDTAGMTHEQLKSRKEEFAQQKRGWMTPILVQMHRQVAFSFACFGFTLVGIPLGIRAHRRETNAGIGMALILMLVYYSFMILGDSLQNHAGPAPFLFLWLPNFLFQAVGAVMLWRVNRGF